FEKTLQSADFQAWQEEAERLRAEGRLVGAGIGYWIDKSGLGVYETAAVDVDPSGAIRVLTGGASTGQGIETVLAQIAADELSVDPGSIEVIYGDTDLIPDGVGSWSSRSTVIGGSAVQAAARATTAKAKRPASRGPPHSSTTCFRAPPRCRRSARCSPRTLPRRAIHSGPRGSGRRA